MSFHLRRLLLCSGKSMRYNKNILKWAPMAAYTNCISQTPQRSSLLENHKSHAATSTLHYSDHLPPATDNESELSAAEYDRVVDETLDCVTQVLEDLGDQSSTSSEYDVNFSSGVITLRLGGAMGTYVINKQTPNQQIWLSSPVSGPKRYDYVGGTWVYKHDGEALLVLLTQELSQLLNTDVNFIHCSHGNMPS